MGQGWWVQATAFTFSKPNRTILSFTRYEYMTNKNYKNKQINA